MRSSRRYSRGYFHSPYFAKVSIPTSKPSLFTNHINQSKWDVWRDNVTDGTSGQIGKKLSILSKHVLSELRFQSIIRNISLTTASLASVSWIGLLARPTNTLWCQKDYRLALKREMVISIFLSNSNFSPKCTPRKRDTTRTAYYSLFSNLTVVTA